VSSRYVAMIRGQRRGSGDLQFRAKWPLAVSGVVVNAPLLQRVAHRSQPHAESESYNEDLSPRPLVRNNGRG
jgi:hypothetical protein